MYYKFKKWEITLIVIFLVLFLSRPVYLFYSDNELQSPAKEIDKLEQQSEQLKEQNLYYQDMYWHYNNNQMKE